MSLEGDGYVIFVLAWSPCGEYLVSGSGKGNLHIWAADTGALIKVLEGHSSSINDLTWSEDGNHIASGSSDGTVIIWDVETILGE